MSFIVITDCNCSKLAATSCHLTPVWKKIPGRLPEDSQKILGRFPVIKEYFRFRLKEYFGCQFGERFPEDSLL